MRKLTATILTTAFLAGGVGAGAALAATPVQHRSDAVRAEHRERSQDRSRHLDRVHHEREAGRSR